MTLVQSWRTARPSGKPAQRKRRSRRWAVRGEIGKAESVGFAMLGLAVPLGLWVLISTAGMMSDLFMPGPIAVIYRFFVWWRVEGFTHDLWISIYRVTMGFLASLAIALPLALLAGTFRPAQVFLEPVMDFIRYMPAVAFIPLVMLWVGIDEGSKIAIIFIGTFFQMVLMMGENVRAVPSAQTEAAQTMGANNRELVWKVIFRSALPSLLDTCRITLGWAWTYLVVAEIVAANAGLGYAILKAQRFLQTDKIFAGILAIGLIGLIQDQLLRWLHRVAFPWLYRR